MAELNKLLAWGVENSAPPADDDKDSKRTQLDPALLAQLFGAHVKDDAEVMKESMATIQDSTLPLQDRETAFDNLEMLVENLDNANNLENLKLWSPLIEQLSNPESSLRHMAAWCCGTAVQNNPKSQTAMLNSGGVEKLVQMALNDPEEKVRSKAAYALSSEIRNMEQALKAAVELLPEEILKGGTYEADNMEAIDGLVQRLRERAKKEVAS